jgi:hypothetical protein
VTQKQARNLGRLPIPAAKILAALQMMAPLKPARATIPAEILDSYGDRTLRLSNAATAR